MKKAFGEQTIHGVIHDLHISEPEIFVDNEARRRSGHMSHALAEILPGKIIDFNSNCSPVRCGGHAAHGWVEYQISEDCGKTFGERQTLPYSWDTFLDGKYTVSVEKVCSLGKNDITAFCLRNDTLEEICCEPWFTPTYINSFDGGRTWSEPVELSPYRGRVYDSRVYNGVIYALEFCNEHFLGSKPEHVYRIFESQDGGKTFSETSVVGIPDTTRLGYGSMIFTPEGELIVYVYNESDPTNMTYARSKDLGKTWYESGKSFVANGIRNPQTAYFDGQYILHGRIHNGNNHSGFVFYTSADGIVWDEGHILTAEKTPCYYSNNLCFEDHGKKKMLVQFSELYNETDACVNVMHILLESV